MRIAFTGIAFFFLQAVAVSQTFIRVDTVGVKENGVFLNMPWVGGLNHCQFSDIDLNLDGIKDLVAFDRTGHKINTFINKGTAGVVDYVHAPEYAGYFPHMENWALMIDYNCDGKEDIFTFNYGVPSAITVYKNTSTASTLQFTLVQQYLQSNYNPGLFPIYMSPVGLPAIEDIDGDGDLDVLMFATGGWQMDYHMNQSKELGYNCDSLIFTHASACWGNFTEVSSNCSATLGTSCRTMNTPPVPPQPENTEDNGGSCLLCLDMDADGDKELYLGQLSCCRISILTNGGSAASANMTSITSNFPDSLTEVNMTYFPCAYFLDMNNDNKRDLIVSSSMLNSSINTESVWYYENAGTDNAPVFSRKTRKLFQENMIDVGEGANPAFFDFDNDGLTDLLISNYDRMYDSCPSTYTYNVRAYKNIGTASWPKFDLVTTNYANMAAQLSSSYGLHLTFGDVDNDTDPDMFVGDYSGLIHYFENTAAIGNPANFVLSAPINWTDVNSVPIDVGSYSTPQLIDVDRDGDLDLLIGEQSGNVNYYQNIGSVTAKSYSLVTTNFGGADVMKLCCAGYSVPLMYDSAGSYRLLLAGQGNRTIGQTTGWISYYTNIDGNLGGTFTLVDSMYQNIWEGIRMTITGADVTNDGVMDLVIGNYAGGVAFYLGDTTLTAIAEYASAPFDFSISPNPSPGQFTLQIEDSKNSPEEFTFEIYNLIGESVLQRSITRKKESFDLTVSNGVYFCELRGEKFRRAKKLVVLR